MGKNPDLFDKSEQLNFQAAEQKNRKDMSERDERYYCSGPNPYLGEWVEENGVPYDPENDDYSIDAFHRPITDTKATPIYNMHTYWSKKPHGAIKQYIEHYTKPGDIVLDPFCGSGGTALMALAAGRKAIAIDLSPAATFITKHYCTPVDIDELEKAFKELERKVEPEMAWLYETRCDRCGGKATTSYTVYSQVFRCEKCWEKVALYDCPEKEAKAKAGKAKKAKACPNCGEEISTSGERFGAIPVDVSYICQSGCSPKRANRKHNDTDLRKREYFQRFDLGKIREIEQEEIQYWYPKNRMMNAPEGVQKWGVKWRSGTSNFRYVHELYTKRNLWALAALLEGIRETSSFGDTHFAKAVFSSISLICSRMCDFSSTQIAKGTYYVPPIGKELNVFGSFSRKWEVNKTGKEDINSLVSTGLSGLVVSRQSATSITEVHDASIDYIFTDPTYADTIQYGELNFVWEAWLGFDTSWVRDEIVVNEVRGLTWLDWSSRLKAAMKECYRVLKPGRWLSLCYHDTSEGTWHLVQDIIAEVGFVVDRVDSTLYIDTGQKSYNQLTAAKVTKRDLVINFRKPKPEELGQISLTFTGKEDPKTFREKVGAIITDYLLQNPGAPGDRIWDKVVSYLVRKGEMKPHKFEEILKEYAEESETGGWYLKEESEALETSEVNKEREAANILAEFINEKYLESRDKGVHYGDVFEHYLHAVPDKPRRRLVDILPDYFVSFEGGWRLPQTEEEKARLSKVRETGINRKIRRYTRALDEGRVLREGDIPDSPTVAEWLHHCYLNGLYGEGKTLFEKGGLDLFSLDPGTKQEAEEDYRLCVKKLGG